MKHEINLTLPIVYSVTDQALQQIEKEYAEYPTDLTIKDNYNFIKAGISKIRKYRSEVEQRRKELKKDALEYGRKVDAAAKKIRERLLAIETPMKALKTDFDTKKEIERREKIRKEEERVEKIHEGITGIKVMVEQSISKNSTEIQALISTLENNDVTEWAQEFTTKALEVRENTLTKLNEVYNMKVQTEKAEDAARKEEEEKKKREEADRQAALKLAEENKRKAAELKALEQKRQAELAKQRAEIEAQKKELAEQQRKIEKQKQAVERARLEKERLEREKKEAERLKAAQEKAEAERLAREKEAKAEREKHDKENFYQTLDIIIPYVKSKKKGGELLNEIRSGEIAHLKWIA